jgi:hypothetical protein
MKHTRSLSLLSLAAGLSLTSCIVADYPPAPRYSASGSSYGTYAALPSNYTGDAYYHGGRYYSGGRYESGTFHDHGQTYSNRYYHDGRYYYGVRHEHHDGRQHDTRRDDDHGRQTHPRSSPYQQLPSFPGTGWRS